MSDSSKFSLGNHRHIMTGPLSVAADIGAIIMAVFERHRQRRALGRLDQRLLRDIGLTADTARKEVNLPFWR